MAERTDTPPHAPRPRTISLVKGDQRWRFHWTPGSEHEVQAALAQMAEDPDHPLDWFDAAVVGQQITNPSAAGIAPAAPPSHDAT